MILCCNRISILQTTNNYMYAYSKHHEIQLNTPKVIPYYKWQLEDATELVKGMLYLVLIHKYE